MKRLGITAGALFLAAAPLAAETWTNVPVIDTLCLSKVKDDPDKRPCPAPCSAPRGATAC